MKLFICSSLWLVIKHGVDVEEDDVDNWSVSHFSICTGKSVVVTSAIDNDQWLGRHVTSPFDMAESVYSEENSSENGPSFDQSTDRNVTVLVGRTAHLHCRVRHLANRTVSTFFLLYPPDHLYTFLHFHACHLWPEKTTSQLQCSPAKQLR